MMKRFKLSMIIGLLGLFGFTCFGYCADETVEDLIVSVGSNSNATINSNGNINIYYAGVSNELGTYCVRINSYDFTENVPLQIGYSKNGTTFDNGTQYLSVYSFDTPNLTCFYIWYGYIMIKNPNSYQITNLNYEVFKLDDLLTENLPKLTSAQCQSEYGLIPESSVDSNYCVENDLCPVVSNFSQLFINDIEHQSAPVINITIPYEYTRDSSINSGQFDLTISGQNVDYEYIDGIIRTQKSSPNSTDFNNIITGLIPLFVPGLVIILFLWFIFKFIKKIF